MRSATTSIFIVLSFTILAIFSNKCNYSWAYFNKSISSLDLETSDLVIKVCVISGSRIYSLKSSSMNSYSNLPSGLILVIDPYFCNLGSVIEFQY